MAIPAVNFTLDKGTDFESDFIVKNSDGSIFSLENYSAVAKIRKYPSSPSYQSFQTGITTSTGEIKVSMASSISSNLISGRNYYDVIIIHNTTNQKKKVFEGTIIANETVSV